MKTSFVIAILSTIPFAAAGDTTPCQVAVAGCVGTCSDGGTDQTQICVATGGDGKTHNYPCGGGTDVSNLESYSLSFLTHFGSAAMQTQPFAIPGHIMVPLQYAAKPSLDKWNLMVNILSGVRVVDLLVLTTRL
ncbi:hypothetical protein Ptr902_04319 [Pyrenophora tritici-repentis]|nr:hypothetical protein Ptr902_04319 [Pyrenophora tritici-repentis]